MSGTKSSSSRFLLANDNFFSYSSISLLKILISCVWDPAAMKISFWIFFCVHWINEDHTSRHRVLNRRMAARSIYGYAGDFGPDTAIRDLQLIRKLGKSRKGEVSRPLDHRWLTPCCDQQTEDNNSVADDWVLVDTVFHVGCVFIERKWKGTCALWVNRTREESYFVLLNSFL